MEKILIIAGGYSNEREISLMTAKSVYSELKKNKKLKIKIQEPNGEFVKNLRKFNPKVVLNLLHGKYGEDGYIQAILESEKVKYAHSGLSSSLAMTKRFQKNFLKNGINTPKYIKHSFKNNLTENKLIKLVNTELGFSVVLKH